MANFAKSAQQVSNVAAAELCECNDVDRGLNKLELFIRYQPHHYLPVPRALASGSAKKSLAGHNFT